MLEHMCRQALVFLNQRLVCPVADDDFAIGNNNVTYLLQHCWKKKNNDIQPKNRSVNF